MIMSVPRFQVYAVEAPDAILPHKVAEVPRHDCVDPRDRSDSDMRRVALRAFAENTSPQIRISEPMHLVGDRCYLDRIPGEPLQDADDPVGSSFNLP